MRPTTGCWQGRPLCDGVCQGKAGRCKTPGWATSSSTLTMGQGRRRSTTKFVPYIPSTTITSLCSVPNASNPADCEQYRLASMHVLLSPHASSPSHSYCGGLPAGQTDSVVANSCRGTNAQHQEGIQVVERRPTAALQQTPWSVSPPRTFRCARTWSLHGDRGNNVSRMTGPSAEYSVLLVTSGYRYYGVRSSSRQRTSCRA